MKTIRYFWGNPDELAMPPDDFLTEVSRLQPNFSVEFCTNRTARKIIERHANDFIELCDELRFDTARSDLFRLIVLDRLGGWYLDYGLLPICRLERFGEKSIVLQRAEKYPGRIVNGCAQSDLGTDFFGMCLRDVKENWRQYRYNYSLPHFAGTRVWTRNWECAHRLNTLKFENLFCTGKIEGAKGRYVGRGARHNWPELQRDGIYRRDGGLYED